MTGSKFRTALAKTSCLAIAAALVQTAPASAQDQDSGAAIEEIIVTSQKREQVLTEVPIAVSVLNESAIENSYTASIESLQTLVPSISFRKGTTNANSALTIRGIGTISFSGAAEPSVATVVDGVVLARSGQAFSDLYDLERIEVLRGPQGTLFGKNASAGVVNIITKRPSNELEGYLEASYFEDNEWKVRGRVSGPITDNVRASLTGFKSRFDGHIRNVFNNRDVNGYDREGVRAMVEYDVSDTLSILAIYEHNSSNDDCCADLEVLPSDRNPSSPAAPDSDGIVNGVADLDLDQRRVDHDFETRTIDRTDAFSIEINKEIADFNLTSISAYRDWKNTEFREGDFTSIGGSSDQPVFGVPFLLHDDGTRNWRQFSQELRLTSPSGERLEYVVGAYYWNLDSESDFTRNASCQNNGGQNQPILDANPGLTCNANDIVSATAFSNTNFENYALFGQGEFDVIKDQLSLLFGFRLTHDEVTFDHNRINNDEFGRQGVGVRPALPNSQFPEASGGFARRFEGRSENTDFSFKAGLRYDTDQYGSAYFTYSQGYKGPAFNVFFNMGANDALPIDEESSDSYEIGYKFATSNFAVNLAAYYTDISGFQANNFDNSTGVTITRLTNAGKVRTKGIELDVSWSPIENLNLTGSLALNDAEIRSFNCPVDPGTGLPPAGCTTRSGLDLLFSPDVNFTLSGDYRIPVNNTFDIVLNATWAHVDDQESLLPGTDGTFNPVSFLPSYDKVDAAITFAFFEDKYRLSFIGKNLFDDSFVTTHSGDNFRYQIPRDAERHFGVNFRANF